MHAQLFGVDSFGNDIIDQFLKIEKTRHSAEKREQYKEKIVPYYCANRERRKYHE